MISRLILFWEFSFIFVKLQLVVVSKKLEIFALLFFSYAWALKRDYDRLEEVSKRVDVNPLGRLVLTWLCKEAWGGGNWQEGGLEGGNCVGGRSDTYFIVLLSEYKFFLVSQKFFHRQIHSMGLSQNTSLPLSDESFYQE